MTRFPRALEGRGGAVMAGESAFRTMELRPARRSAAVWQRNGWSARRPTRLRPQTVQNMGTSQSGPGEGPSQKRKARSM